MNNHLIVKLLEDQSVVTAITLLITTACSVGVARLNYRRSQILEMTKGAKRSSLRSEYLQIYNSNEFTVQEKYDMTRPLINEYINELGGNHYIHGLDSKLKEKLEAYKSEDNK